MKTKLTNFLATTAFALSLSPQMAASEEINILNWNVEQGSIENIIRRTDDFQELAKVSGTPDVMIVQEINSVASAIKIAEHMNIESPHIAVSDFGHDEEIIFFGFETAVISRYPIVSVTEYQHKTRPNSKAVTRAFENTPFLVDETGVIALAPQESAKDIKIPKKLFGRMSKGRNFRVSRGLLRVELANGLVIYPVHLKSNLPAICGQVNRDLSGARSNLNKIARQLPEYSREIAEAKHKLDLLYLKELNKSQNLHSLRNTDLQERLPAFTDAHLQNAVNRENTVAALAKLISKDLKNDQLTVIVAGDFNTPISEPSKTGTNIEEDCLPKPLSCSTKIVPNSCEGKDGFDDTHHILNSGIAFGVQMKATFDGAQTYSNDGFAPSPIDNIYIAGRMAKLDSQAVRLGDREPVLNSEGKQVKGKFTVFGSDHYPLRLRIGE